MKVSKAARQKIYNANTKSPLFSTNIITDNKTKPDGNVENFNESNAAFGRKWVDDNHK
ncbi:MAG: hypothetical protein RR540_03905 [Oscillospiraceae bacterium]